MQTLLKSAQHKQDRSRPRGRENPRRGKAPAAVVALNALYNIFHIAAGQQANTEHDRQKSKRCLFCCSDTPIPLFVTGDE